MVFVHYFLSSTNEWAFVYTLFLCCNSRENCFKHFFKKYWKIFLIDIMTYNKLTIKETFKEVWYNENASMKFLWIFLSCSFIRKYVKIMFKNRGSPCYFLSSKGQKIKNITKIGQKRLFLFTFLVSFFLAFLAQKMV